VIEIEKDKTTISKERLEEIVKDRVFRYSMTVPIKRMIIKDGEPFIEYFTHERYVSYPEFVDWVRTQIIKDIENSGMTIWSEEEKN